MVPGVTNGRSARQFTMSELVERTGVPAATVRFYLAEGLLPNPVQAAPNRFLYDERHVELVRLIRLLRERRALGLGAIKRLLPEMLPDLVGGPEGGVFRPEVWRELLAANAPDVATRAVGDRLLEAGLESFRARGFADVSIDDVCRAAGVAKGSFYRHFASKEEIFLAVARQVATRAAGAIAAGSIEIAPVEAVASAFETDLVVLLDLASLAAQNRPFHREALLELSAGVAEAMRVRYTLFGDASAERLLQEGVGLALDRRLTGDLAWRPARSSEAR